MTMPVYAMTDTWNSGGTTFTAIKMNVTDTASAAGSLLMDLQVGGSSKFQVYKDGGVTAGQTSTSSFGSVNVQLSVSWLSDTFVLREAANVLAQRNGVNAQRFNVYKTYTDDTHKGMVSLLWDAGQSTYALYADGAGGASTGPLSFGVNGGPQWQINGGNFIAFSDNAYDIGASGASRPRNVYVAGAITAGGSITASGNISLVGADLTVTIGTTGTPALILSTSANSAHSFSFVSDGNNAYFKNLSSNGNSFNIRNSSNADIFSVDFAAGAGTLAVNNDSSVSVGAILKFAGSSSSFPALKRSSTLLQARLADDSAYCGFEAARFGAGGVVSTSTFLNLAAGTTASSALRFIQGAAPTSPVDGDMWREDNTNTGLKIRVNGVTKTVTLA